MPQDQTSKRIYPPPPPAQQLPQGYTDDTGQPVYNHPSTYHNADPNYVELSDPIQRLFYAILGAIPKPREAASGLAKFATTSPKQLETQALQAAGRAVSKPGMQQHPAMAASEGFANTLLQFLGIPSESMAQRASTGDISGAIGEGYGTYLAGKGLGKVGKPVNKAVGIAAEDIKSTIELNKYLKQFEKEQKNKSLFSDEEDVYVKGVDYSDPDKFANEYGQPIDFSQDNEWWNDPDNAKKYLESGGDKDTLKYLQTGKWPYQHPASDKFTGIEVSAHRPQHQYGQEEINKPSIKEGHPNPEDYNSLKEFAQKRLYGHILNSLYSGYNEGAINRLKNTDPEFEKVSEAIAEWKGSPKHLQDLTGDILFGKSSKVQNVYGYEAARSLADAYRTSPEVDYTLYRGIMVSQYGDPTPYLQLKPGDKLPFFRLHGYTQRERVADNFSNFTEKYYGEDDNGNPITQAPYYSIKFIVEGPKQALNITHLNGFENEAEHLMNGEYLVKQVVTNGKKIKIIMQQERPLYAGEEKPQAKPMGPGGAK